MAMDVFLGIILKNFFLFLSCTYSTIKMVPKNSNLNHKKCIIIFFLDCLVSVGTFFVNCYIPQVNTIWMIVVSVAIYAFLFDMDITSAAIVTIIGYGVSHLAYTLAALILTTLMFMCKQLSLQVCSIFPYIAVGPIQLLFVFLLFKIRRFQRGIPVLSDVKYGDIGIYLSVTVLMVIYILGLYDHATIVIPVLVCLLFMCGLTLFYWWKKRITQDYLTQLHKREQQELQKELAELQKELNALKEDHDRLSQVVHKDNKLIPAMELAVSQLLYSVAQDENRQSRMEQSQKILEQLKSLSEERAGIIRNYEDTTQKLPVLGLSGLDALFQFMMQKARMTGIAFDLRLEEGVAQILTQSTSESDACTLLADLIENALIAVSHNEQEKAIQVDLGTDEGSFYIRVSDSGAPFPPEVLKQWGVARITTHADTGGSGIGLMTIYELCQKYGASFEIKQLQNRLPYRKCVCVRYDGRNTFQVS